MTKPLKDNKSASIILISSCMVFIISIFLFQWDYLTNISYRLHESFAILINIGIFLIPMEALVWFTNWIRYRINRNDLVKNNPMLNLISVLSLLMCIYIFTYFMIFNK